MTRRWLTAVYLLSACSDVHRDITAPVTIWTVPLDCGAAPPQVPPLKIAATGALPLDFQGRGAVNARVDARFDRRLELASAAASTSATPTGLEDTKVPFLVGIEARAGVRPMRSIENWNVGFGSDPSRTCAAAEHLAVPGEPDAREVRVLQQRPSPASSAGTVAHAMAWINWDVRLALMLAKQCPVDDDGLSPSSETWCWPRMFQVEYGRDPFGAGGWAWSEMQDWLSGYGALADAVRQRFPVPANDVSVGGPSTIEFASQPANSPEMAAFLAYLATTGRKISFLSAEIEAADPAGVVRVIDRMRSAADAAGIQPDRSVRLPLHVSDLRLDPSAWPESIRGDFDLQSTWLGAFYLGSAIMLEGKAELLTTGRTEPFVSDCGEAGDPRNLWPADLRAFGRPSVADGTPTAASWWFLPFIRTEFPANKRTLLQQSRENVHVLVTGMQCGASLGAELAPLCTKGESCAESKWELAQLSDPASKIPPQMTRVLRILVSDMRAPDANSGALEIATTLPPGVDQAFVRQMSMTGRPATWQHFTFDAQTLVTPTGGNVVVRFEGGSPAMHFAEVFF